MKKLISTLFALAVVALCWAAQPGGSPVQVSQMPGKAQNFIKKHYGDTQVASATQNLEAPKGYDVAFVNGSTVSFDGKGNWTEATAGSSVLPDKLVPKQLQKKVVAEYPNRKIVGIKLEGGNYGLTLDDKSELTFDKQFKLLNMYK